MGSAPPRRVAHAGGVKITDTFISPLDLIEIGLVSSAEAEGRP